MQHALVQYSPEMEGFATLQGGPLQSISGRPARQDHVFNESELLEAAAELLESSGQQELDRTLAKLIDRASRALARPVNAALAGSLRSALRRLAQDTLPFAGRRLGAPTAAAGNPATARPAGSTTAAATRAFGLELEGLSPEDKEFELAKSFARLAGDAVRRALSLPQAAEPQARALRGVAEAARRWAPGLPRDLDLARDPRGTSPEARSLTQAQGGKESTMHDIDRTQREYAGEFAGFQGEQMEFGEGEWSPEGEGTFNEAEEMELATELLSVTNEGELDRFLGDLVSKATRAVGSFARSDVGRAVGGVLKGVAKKALPLAGAAVGTYLGGPLGARIGTGLANAAGSALGLEGEMASEDREFEGAKQFVRLAGQTAAAAASAPPGANPSTVAQQAAVAAARQLAPGLLSGMQAPSSGAQQGGGTGARSGRWLRRGNKIVLYGL